MRTLPIVLAVALAASVGLALSYAQQDKPKAPAAGEKETKEKKPVLPRCPISNETVNFNVSLKTKEGAVYFCCPKCVEKYEGAPEKYAKAVGEQRKAAAALPKVQVSCPISGKAVSKKASIEQDGNKIFFCCKECPEVFKKDPAKGKAKLAECYTYQTTCPVMGEEIDPGSSLKTADGKIIYFCCDMCQPKLLKDPGKYLPNLEAQGYQFDAAKLKSEKE